MALVIFSRSCWYNTNIQQPPLIDRVQTVNHINVNERQVNNVLYKQVKLEQYRKINPNNNRVIQELLVEMVGCSALGCENAKPKAVCPIKCFFPKDSTLKRAWVAKMKRGRWKPGNQAFLCELHFEPEMWLEENGTKALRADAIPSLFTFVKRTLRRRKRKPIKDYSTTEESSISESSSSTSSENESSTSSKDIAIVESTNPKPESVAAVNPQMNDQALAQKKVFNPCSQYKGTNAYVNNYPICQDVRFCKLPFYNMLAELLKPSTLIPSNSHRSVHEKMFYFYLTPQQADDIIQSRTIKPGFICEFEKQVHLRFCLSETVCEQEDFFPPNVSVKVNNRICPLPVPIPTSKPNVEAKRPSVPVNITPFIKLSSTVANCVSVTSYATEYGPGFTISISLVKKLSARDLVDHLKRKGEMHSDLTRSLIKEKLNEDADSEITTTCLRVSLLCPLGKMRMSLPCRASTCKHLQCFDGSIFLEMNERKPTWNCPVCDKPALFDNLVIDGYFNEVMASSSLSSETNEIELNKDGSWSIHSRATVISSRPANDDAIEIICDDDPPPQQISNGPKSIEVVDLVISDSDEEKEAEPAPSSAVGAAVGVTAVAAAPATISDTIISLDSSSTASSSSSSSNSDSDDLPLSVALGKPLNWISNENVEKIAPLLEQKPAETRREPSFYPASESSFSEDGQPSKYCKLNNSSKSEEDACSTSSLRDFLETVKPPDMPPIDIDSDNNPPPIVSPENEISSSNL